MGSVGIGEMNGVGVEVEVGDFFGFGINKAFHFFNFLMVKQSINSQYCYRNVFLEFMVNLKIITKSHTDLCVWPK